MEYCNDLKDLREKRQRQSSEVMMAGLRWWPGGISWLELIKNIES